MASKQQQLFAKIVLHNKLLEPPEVERLLEQFPDPEEMIRHLIASKTLNEKTGSQLRRLYEKQIEKLGLHHDTAKVAVDPSPSGQADIDALVEEAAEQKRRENEDFDVVDGGFGAYHPLDLESAYAKLGERATWQVRSRPLTQQFTEGGPLNPRDFRRRVRSEFPYGWCDLVYNPA